MSLHTALPYGPRDPLKRILSREAVLNRVLPSAITEKIMGYVHDLEWAEHRHTYRFVLGELWERGHPCESIGHVWSIIDWYPGSWESMALMECHMCKERVVRHT
jgi:hypothetical protein